VLSGSGRCGKFAEADSRVIPPLGGRQFRVGALAEHVAEMAKVEDCIFHFGSRFNRQVVSVSLNFKCVADGACHHDREGCGRNGG
jgi:hypothetical protein